MRSVSCLLRVAATLLSATVVLGTTTHCLSSDQRVSLVGLKNIKVSVNVIFTEAAYRRWGDSLTDNTPDKKMYARGRKQLEGELATNLLSLFREALPNKGFALVKENAHAGLRFHLSIAAHPTDKRKLALNTRFACRQWVQLTRSPNLKFLADTCVYSSPTVGVTLTPFNEQDASAALRAIASPFTNFLADWQSANAIANSLATARSSSNNVRTRQNNPPRANNIDLQRRRQQATNNYKKTLEEWNAANQELNSARSFRDLYGGLSTVAPAASTPLDKFIRGVAPAGFNSRIRDAQTKVDVARQNLNVAVQQLYNAGLNPFELRIR